MTGRALGVAMVVQDEMACGAERHVERAEMSDEVIYDWISARMLRLSRQRTLHGFRCEVAYRGFGGLDDPDQPKCYHSGAAEEDWCDNCRTRNRLYSELKPLRQRERAAFRRLQRAAERLKRAHDSTAKCAIDDSIVTEGISTR